MDRIQDAIAKMRARQAEVVRPVEGARPSAREIYPNQPAVAPSRPANGHLDHVFDPLVIDSKRTILNSTEAAELAHRRVIAGLDNDDRVEPYRQLRTQLLKTMHDNRWNTLAVTSAHEGAGKSLTSTNLAISISRDMNHTVLLVDLDLRTPTVHEKLNMPVEHALIDYLTGDTSLEDVLAYPGYQRLVVVPGRSLGKFSSEVLSSPQMSRFMSEVCGTYDPSRIIIFDLPPLLRNDDALLFTPSVDATLLVVEDGVTTNEQLEHALSLLEGRANLIGTILNKAR
jgi:capsular exopolysaccharide synthesis family protein